MNQNLHSFSVTPSVFQTILSHLLFFTQSKVQKQQAFDAEILANRSQIDSVSATAVALNNADHYASERVDKRVEDLSELWEALCAASKEKAQRLEEAVQEQQLLRDIDDVEAWMETVETTLNSEELVSVVVLKTLTLFEKNQCIDGCLLTLIHSRLPSIPLPQGKDLASVNALLKRHGLTEANISAYRERVEGLQSQGEALVAAGHFDSDAISERCESLSAR